MGLATLVSSTAWGQDSASDVAAARALGTEGLRLAESGNCAAAVDKLKRAEELHHAPTTLERLGECQISLGHYVDGTESLRRVVREHIPDGSPPVFFAAQTRANEALEKALPHLAKVRIEVSGPPPDAVTLTIDGAPASNATLGVERPIDPGAHTVEATAKGWKPASAKFKLDKGGARVVALTLEPNPNEPKVETPLVPVGPSTVTVTKRNYVPAIVDFGVTGVALVLGGVFGGVALAKKNDLVASCGGTTTCRSAQRPAFDDVTTFANISTVSFVVAGVAAATGVVLMLIAPKRTVIEHVAVSPFGAWITGTF